MREEIDLQLTIEIMSGPDDGRQVRFRLADGDGNTGPDGAWIFTLGRRDDCDLCLPFDTQISRLHARVVHWPGRGWMLEDCGSRNGTFIGKQQIAGPVALAEQILFRIGRTWLRLQHME